MGGVSRTTEGENKMTKNQVMDIIDTFACSQGFYGRLGRSIREAEARGEDVSPWFEQFKDCTSDLDVILKIES